MAYLSRIFVNPWRQGAQRLFRSPQCMHAAILQGIPAPEVTERVLWRVDADQPRRPTLLVLTRTKPSWEHLVEQAGWPSADTPQAEVRDYLPLLERLQAGQRFAFRLTANPVQATRNPDKLTPAQARARDRDSRKSVRVGHRTVAHQLDWLLRRVDSWGVSIPAARTDPSPLDDPVPGHGPPPQDVRVSGRQRLSFKRQDHTVTVQQVTYEGHLIVEEPDRLRDVLLRGIGKAKAYGCGLLTLAPSDGA